MSNGPIKRSAPRSRRLGGAFLKASKHAAEAL